MKKTLILFILFILFITPMVSAAMEWDNVREYNEKTKTILVTNALGFGKDIAKITLNTPLKNYVIRGRNREVAEITIENFEDYNNVFEDMDFYYIDNGMKKFNRNFIYKYKTHKNVEIIDYDMNCQMRILINQSIENYDCKRIQVGSHYIQKEILKDFDEQLTLKKGNITLSIITDVYEDDNVEWIGKFFGERITEWAIWTDSLSINNTLYYYLNNSGDSVSGVHNITNLEGSPIYENKTGCLFGGCLEVSIGNNFDIKISPFTNFGSSQGVNRTMSFWFNSSHENLNLEVAFLSQNDTISGGYILKQTTGFPVFVNMFSDGTYTGANISVGSWEHYAFVLKDNGTLQHYRNGTLVYTDSTLFSPNNSWQFGTYTTLAIDSVGTFDEIAFWDRQLSTLEISNLYNDGAGLTRDAAPQITSIIDVTLNNPSHTSNSNENSTIFNSSANFENLNITNATLFIWYSDLSIFNKTTISLTGNVSNNTGINITGFIVDQYHWNFLWCGTNSTSAPCSFATSNFTFNFIPFTVDDIGFNNNTFETSSELFTINITTQEGFSIQSADLIYNNTKFSGAKKIDLGNKFNIQKIIDIPIGTKGFNQENRTFFWNISLSDETTGIITNVSATINNHNVNELRFAKCNLTLNESFINFTLKDEINNTDIDPSITPTSFSSTFNFWLGSGNIFKNTSLEFLVNSSTFSYNFCTRTISKNKIIKINFDSLYSAQTYSEREYTIRKGDLTNETTLIDLFLILTADSTKFFIDVKDGVTPLQNSIITITKFFVGEGVFKTTSIRETDDKGELIEFLDLDKNYRYLITKNGELLGIIEKKATCESAPCTLSLVIRRDINEIFGEFESTYAANVISSITFNESSKIVTYTFIDITGLANFFRLKVQKTSFNNTVGTNVCDQSLFSSSGSINCNVTGFTGNFIATGTISRSPEVIDIIKTFVISTLKTGFGIMSIFLSLVIIITLCFGGAAISRGNPQVVLFSFGASIFITKLMELFPFSWAVVVSIEILVFFLMGRIKS